MRVVRAVTRRGVTTWTVVCPFCGREHVHGAAGGPGPRTSDCSPGGCYVIEAPTGADSNEGDQQ